jgi:hypothetical protein
MSGFFGELALKTDGRSFRLYVEPLLSSVNQEVQVLVVPRRKHTTSRLYEIFPLVRAFINFQAEDVPEAAKKVVTKW